MHYFITAFFSLEIIKLHSSNNNPVIDLLFSISWYREFNHGSMFNILVIFSRRSCHTKIQSNIKLQEILSLKIWSPAEASSWYGDEKRVQFRGKIVLIAIYSESFESPSFICSSRIFWSSSPFSERKFKMVKYWSTF